MDTERIMEILIWKSNNAIKAQRARKSWARMRAREGAALEYCDC